MINLLNCNLKIDQKKKSSVPNSKLLLINNQWFVWNPFNIYEYFRVQDLCMARIWEEYEEDYR